MKRSYVCITINNYFNLNNNNSKEIKDTILLNK